MANNAAADSDQLENPVLDIKETETSGVLVAQVGQIWKSHHCNNKMNYGLSIFYLLPNKFAWQDVIVTHVLATYMYVITTMKLPS